MSYNSEFNDRLRFLALVKARSSGILPDTIQARQVHTRKWVQFASLSDAAAQLQINIGSALAYMLVRFGAQVVDSLLGKYDIRYMYNELPIHVSLSAQRLFCEEEVSNVIVTRHQSKHIGSNNKHTSLDDLDSISMRYAMTHIQEKRRYGTKRNSTTTTIELPREILSRIIIFAVSSRSERDTFEKPLQVDMYRGISDLRGTCKAFYYTLLDSWDNFQGTFFNRVWERCCTERLRMCDVLSHIDPLSHRRIEMSNTSVEGVEAMVKLSDSFVLIAQKNVNSILRFYSTPYLIIMATNERNLRGQNNYGIPTLSGFAQFIANKRLKLYVKKALARDPPQYAEAIDFFHTVKEWNMLSIGSCRGIDSYLETTNGEIIDSWHRKSEEFGRKEMRCSGLHNNITSSTASSLEQVFLPVEFRPACEINNDVCLLVPFVWEVGFSIGQDRCHVVYDFVLPVRLMRLHDDCITMNIPLSMVRVMIEDDILNEIFDKELLPDLIGLDEENFKAGASIIMSRRCDYECELLLDNNYFDGHCCVLEECSKAVPYCLCHDYKVEDTSDGKDLAVSTLPLGEWTATPLFHEWGTTSLVANDNYSDFTLNVDHRAMTRSFCNGSFIDLRLARTFDCSASNTCAPSREHFYNNRFQLWQEHQECIVKADDFSILVNDYIDLRWERHQFAFGTKQKTKTKTLQCKKIKIKHNKRCANTHR
jgi:hypothetical protein